jgi:hypothetical protein
MIPRILHLCFGMSPDFGGKPWSLVHHVCLSSALEFGGIEIDMQGCR